MVAPGYGYGIVAIMALGYDGPQSVSVLHFYRDRHHTLILDSLSLSHYGE